MAKQFFVLGIGGTGMRCIESLIHLCAMGMFDDTVVHLLALDTDKNNGNFARLKELKDKYLTIKGSNSADRVPLKNTYFSADLRYYEFSPNYEKKSNFKAVFNYGDTKFDQKRAIETDLADLVLTDNVEEFDLKHGYRAQTHLGSMMMYHSIIEAANDTMPNDLKRFLQELNTSTQSDTAKVFILGSVFGGTGASSIPIIPQAISKAASIISPGSANVLQSAYFGSTLLTAYFSFNQPSGDERASQKVIATSDKFALNSQVAMMFYDDDTTVKRTYQRLYMIGTQDQSYKPMVTNDNQPTHTITGGAEQKNDCHYIELLAASAALDFFNTPNDKLAEIKKNGSPAYLYRAVDDLLQFRDFVGSDLDKAFARRFGTLVVFAMLTLRPDYDFPESVRSGRQQDIAGFRDIDPAQLVALKDYFKLFYLDVTPEAITDGWLVQLNRSAGGGDKFLFNPLITNTVKQKGVGGTWNKNFKWNAHIYRDRDKDITKGWSFNTGLFSNPFDAFKKKFIEVNNSSIADSIQNPAERLYKTIYETLGRIYNIKD